MVGVDAARTSQLIALDPNCYPVVVPGLSLPPPSATPSLGRPETAWGRTGCRGLGWRPATTRSTGRCRTRPGDTQDS
jgi:hypothetical protein